MNITFHLIFTKALRSLFHKEILAMMIVPFLGSALVVFAGLYFSWDFFMMIFHGGSAAVAQWLQMQTGSWASVVNSIFQWLGWLGPILLMILLFLISIPLILTINIIIVSVLVSTRLVRVIGEKDYPHLQWKGRGRFTKGLINSLGAGVLFILAWILTLPLWLIPGFSILAPLLLAAWMNRKVCLFDASTDMADDYEFEKIKSTLSGKGFLLGLVTSSLNYIPFFFLLTPIFTMVSYVHLVFMALDSERNDPTP